jgi:aspartyl-tRNA(Asn)/glutamyl-tRNA(Gln) amidotransferase subunit B
MKYVATIGMEVHAELRTNTKMFCASKNDPDEKHPNLNICPVCVGHPGTLPVPNEEAIRQVHRVGLAIGGEVQKESQFDRKNYFYPDLPKGYQISQYKHPFIWGGELHGVHITRVHLEEDTARLIHETRNMKHEAYVSGFKFQDSSLVDFNRAGVPLMELVTEPVIHTAKDARLFVEELQLLLQYLGASNANMEKGEMRCEANISIRPESQKEFGTKVEVKNLNSFRAVEGAILYEIGRQTKVLEAGDSVVQETRGWNDAKKETFSQRAKESEHDYRYFPEPDIPPFEFNDEYIKELSKTLPELPQQKRERFMGEYGIGGNLTEVIVRERGYADFWEHVVSELDSWLSGKTPGFDEKKPGVKEESYKFAANYFTSDFLGVVREKEIPINSLLVDAENFAELIKMIVKKEINSRVAKDVLLHMIENGGDPSTIVKDKGLGQVSDESALEEIAKNILEKNQGPVADYKKGKTNALQFLVGQFMKETKGTANPEVARALLTKLIEGV